MPASFTTGTAQRDITPNIGIELAGWAIRASGDCLARYIRDPLMVKALAVEADGNGWILISVDMGGVDAEATEAVRQAVHDVVGLAPQSVLVCCTHTHSGPTFRKLGIACTRDSLMRSTVNTAGKIGNMSTDTVDVGAAPHPAGPVDQAWREHVIQQMIEAATEAWQNRRPAKAEYGEAPVHDVASSRRRLLKDGTWADPRSRIPEADEIVHQTQIDPLVRVLTIRDAGSDRVRTVLTNYGCHPWVFSIAGVSAELPGETSKKLAAALQSDDDEPISVICTTGPQGDVTTIWSADIDSLWRTRPDETVEQSLERRTRSFEEHLDKFSDRIVAGALQAVRDATPIDIGAATSKRVELTLPTLNGYEQHPEVHTADWQRAAPPGHLLTEIQLLEFGGFAIMGLPGEPFTALGAAIREKASRPLIITALSNECSAFAYIAEAEDVERGGYEMLISPLMPGSGERLVEHAIGLLNSK